MSTTAKETDLAALALAALGPQWSEYWTEVPSASGRVDIVGRDADGGLHAVECKTRPSLALAAQGLQRIEERAFSTVLCVVGAEAGGGFHRQGGITNLAILGVALGFGVATVRGEKFNVELAPRWLNAEDGPRAVVAQALNEVHRAVASAAGSPSSAYWTLWKQGIHEVAMAVAAEPGITARQLRRKANLHGVLYWLNEAAQVRMLAEQSKRVRVDSTGREYRYYPVGVPQEEGK